MSTPCLPVVHRKRKRGDGPISKSLQTGDEGDAHNKSDEDETFDDIESIDAAEYLSRVVNQAKKIPDVLVSQASKYDRDTYVGVPKRHRNHVPIDGSAADLAYLVSGRASLTRPPTEQYLPTQNSKWIKSTIASFERLRNYLEECREKGVGGKLTNRTVFPPMKDRPGWHVFCLGFDEANGNVKSYFGDDYDATDLRNKQESKEEKAGDEMTIIIPEWKREIPTNGHTPIVRLVSQMDQVLVRKVLSHLCYYTTKGWTMTQQRSTWIYAMLARLEKPVHRDDASNLFGLLKTLTLMRSKLGVHGEDRSELSRLNVLICLVGIFFEQGTNISMFVV